MIVPRVLIISNNSFSNIYNNGKTLEALFSSFPKENLAQLFFHEGSMPDFSFCENYWKISEMDLIRNVGKCNKCVGREVLPQSNTEAEEIGSYPKVLRFIKEKTGNLTRDMIWRFCTWYSQSLDEWLRKFNPQIIFFVGSSASFSTRIAMRLSSSLSVPMAVYYTDDYLLSINKKSLVKKIRFNHIYTLYKKVIGASALHFAIGEMMAQEYSNLFNTPFYPIMNSVKIEPFSVPLKNNEILISYFGGLHLNRWLMLVRLAKLLPQNARIYVYTAPENIDNKKKAAFDEAGVEIKGLLKGRELKEAMKKADVLLHVESDDEDNRRFTRLAISTKLPEYLITGRPIIGFGPVEVASMRLLSDNEIGLVVNSDKSDPEIKEAITEIVGNYEKRKYLATKGYQYAEKMFDERNNSKALMERLLTVFNQ